MMITPKATFANIPELAKPWTDVVDSKLFDRAAQAALNEMCLRNSGPADMATAASFAWRIEGAKQFLGILMGLTEASATAPKKPTGNLNHKPT